MIFYPNHKEIYSTIEKIWDEKEGNIIKVLRSNDSKKVKALHGLTRALIVNMVTGVCDGFKKILVIEGLGYKAETKGNKLVSGIK